METEFPTVQFYDYSKLYLRAYKDLPSNYHLTLSYSEANPDFAEAVLNAHKLTGVNVAVVFRDKDTIPTSFAGSTVLDGDKDDLRFLDAPRHIVALYAKGDARKDDTGFVIDGKPFQAKHKRFADYVYENANIGIVNLEDVA